VKVAATPSIAIRLSSADRLTSALFCGQPVSCITPPSAAGPASSAKVKGAGSLSIITDPTGAILGLWEPKRKKKKS
jgi:hypothetical protein